MSLKYEPASEPLHISVKELFASKLRGVNGGVGCAARDVSPTLFREQAKSGERGGGSASGPGASEPQKVIYFYWCSNFRCHLGFHEDVPTDG